MQIAAEIADLSSTLPYRVRTQAAAYHVLLRRTEGEPVVPPAFYHAPGHAGLERVLGITANMTLQELLYRKRVSYESFDERKLRRQLPSLYSLPVWLPIEVPESTKQWDGVNCGSDLFVRGLKRFDIKATYEALLRKRMRFLTPGGRALRAPGAGAHDHRCIDSNPWKHEVRFATVPSELRACGHFPKLLDECEFYDRGYEYHDFERLLKRMGYLLSSTVPECEARRKHLIRFSSWWNDLRNAAALDELCDEPLGIFDARDWPEGGETMAPPRLLRTMREAKARRIRGPDVPFVHLKSLPDGPPLSVIRSSHALADVANQLCNCAAGYSSLVQRKECVFVVARSPKDGKPFALGEYAIPESMRFLIAAEPASHADLEQYLCWSEIREHSNKPASRETRHLYESYEPVIRKWWTTEVYEE